METPELDIFDDPDYNSKLDSARALIASGKKVSDLVEKCESGHAAIASIFTGAIEHGGAEETSLSARLAKASCPCQTKGEEIEGKRQHLMVC